MIVNVVYRRHRAARRVRLFVLAVAKRSRPHAPRRNVAGGIGILPWGQHTSLGRLTSQFWCPMLRVDHGTQERKAVKTLLLTREYPPHVYGGAGVHVEYLSQELAQLMDVEVRSFGEQDQSAEHLRVKGYPFPVGSYHAVNPKLRGALDTLQTNLVTLTDAVDADVVHCHTWYSHLAGILTKISYGIPLVVTTHSLEPLRPWKREQLGRGYDLSSWVEKTALEMADAIVAVSRETKADILRLFDVRPERVTVIYNGIQIDEYRPTAETGALQRQGVDLDRPYVLFVGRITRQKGIIHLVNAIPHISPEAQIVLLACAAPGHSGDCGGDGGSCCRSTTEPCQRRLGAGNAR